MIPLDHVISAERVFFEDLGASKKKVLQSLAERMAFLLPDVTELTLFDQIMTREKLGSTGIGSGIAVPHCRLEGLSKPIAALAKLPDGIDFQSIDGERVDVIVLLIVPADANDEHLELLASVVERLGTPAQINAIRESSNSQSLYNAFIKTP